MNPRKKNQLHLKRRMIHHLHPKLTTSQHLLPTPNLPAAANQKINHLQRKSLSQLHLPKRLNQHRVRRMTTRAALPRIIHHRLHRIMALLPQLPRHLAAVVAVPDHQHRVAAHLALWNLATNKVNPRACLVVRLLV